MLAALLFCCGRLQEFELGALAFGVLAPELLDAAALEVLEEDEELSVVLVDAESLEDFVPLSLLLSDFLSAPPSDLPSDFFSAPSAGADLPPDFA